MHLVTKLFWYFEISFLVISNICSISDLICLSDFAKFCSIVTWLKLIKLVRIVKFQRKRKKEKKKEIKCRHHYILPAWIYYQHEFFFFFLMSFLCFFSPWIPKLFFTFIKQEMCNNFTDLKLSQPTKQI